MITVADVMSTRPCEAWTPERVAGILSRHDCSSFAALTNSLIASGKVSIADLRLTLCRFAALHHRESVFTPWVVWVAHQLVGAQRARYGSRASPATIAIWDRIERWHGGREIQQIRRAAFATSADAAAALTASIAAHVYAAAAAAYAASYVAHAFANDDGDYRELARRIDEVAS